MKLIKQAKSAWLKIKKGLTSLHIILIIALGSFIGIIIYALWLPFCTYVTIPIIWIIILTFISHHY